MIPFPRNMYAIKYIPCFTSDFSIHITVCASEGKLYVCLTTISLHDELLLNVTNLIKVAQTVVSDSLFNTTLV